MKKTCFLIMSTLFIGLLSCQKAPDAPTGSSKVSAGNTTIENIKATSVKANSSFNAGFSELQDHGFCWGVNANPDLNASHKSLGSTTSTGNFSADITLLTESTHYFIRSFLKSQDQVRYGEQNEYTTLSVSLPQVTTSNVTNITATSATCGGNVTSDGDGTVSTRGVCWNASGNPTLTNCINYTTDGSGTGSFQSSLTELFGATTIYLVSYATNEKGTAYGEIKQFTTEWPCGSTVSHDGKNYQTIQIGTQCWFKENLNIGTRINGTQSQTNNGIIEKYCYDDNEIYCNTYGGLYQWDELMQYVTNQGAKGLCPNGWHIPTDAEWSILTTYLGGESVAGGKMKEAGTAHWLSPNTVATTSSGFTVLPGGYRTSNGNFDFLTSNAFIWSSSEQSSAYTWYRSLSNDVLAVSRFGSSKTIGFSCRCIQN